MTINQWNLKATASASLERVLRPLGVSDPQGFWNDLWNNNFGLGVSSEIDLSPRETPELSFGANLAVAGAWGTDTQQARVETIDPETGDSNTADAIVQVNTGALSADLGIFGQWRIPGVPLTIGAKAGLGWEMYTSQLPLTSDWLTTNALNYNFGLDLGWQINEAWSASLFGEISGPLIIDRSDKADQVEAATLGLGANVYAELAPGMILNISGGVQAPGVQTTTMPLSVTTLNSGVAPWFSISLKFGF